MAHAVSSPQQASGVENVPHHTPRPLAYHLPRRAGKVVHTDAGGEAAHVVVPKHGDEQHIARLKDGLCHAATEGKGSVARGGHIMMGTRFNRRLTSNTVARANRG